jgi:cytochrome c oxidase assembly protein subunit 15
MRPRSNAASPGAPGAHACALGRSGDAPPGNHVSHHGSRRLARLAWIVVAWNLVVIGWGAYVRATGSGAGCGQHWPLCNGEIVPRAPAMATVIELTHRLTSGLALLALLALVVAVWRSRPAGHPARYAAGWSMLFMLTEAGVGAGLVLFELVADNASLARALFMAVHLANTFLLLGAMTLTARWLDDGPVGMSLAGRRGRGAIVAALALGVLVVSVSGAVAALGDTLFPATSLAQALEQDLSPASHVLLRLRVIHPTLAAIVALALIVVAPRLPIDGEDARGRLGPGSRVALLAGLQVGLGVLNVVLLAPVWLQLVHLLIADLLWIAMVLLGAAVLAGRAAPSAYRVSAVGPYIAGTGTSSIRR